MGKDVQRKPPTTAGKRRRYKKPRITRVSLVAEEAMLGACKVTNDGPAGACIGASPCPTVGS